MPHSEIEEWRPIECYEGCYEVSNLGRVRSLARVVTRTDGRTCPVGARVLKPSPNERGYLHVSLRPVGCKSTRLVHQLVCVAWHGTRPDGLEVRHRDGDKNNNAATNLCWGTPQENVLDRLAHGLARRALRTHCRWDHPLRKPNLRASDPSRCLACDRAHSYCRLHPELDFRATADAYLAEIMAVSE